MLSSEAVGDASPEAADSDEELLASEPLGDPQFADVSLLFVLVKDPL